MQVYADQRYRESPCDDWTDRLIGFPAMIESHQDVVKNVCSIPAMSSAERIRRVALVRGAVNSHGVGGRLFQAKDLAEETGFSTMQVAKIMDEYKLAVAVRRDYDARMWRSNDGQRAVRQKISAAVLTLSNKNRFRSRDVADIVRMELVDVTAELRQMDAEGVLVTQLVRLSKRALEWRVLGTDTTEHTER